MKPFEERKQSKGQMPSAYVTYEIADENNANSLASRDCRETPAPSGLRSPDLQARNNAKTGSVVQKSVDRLENWLGSRRKSLHLHSNKKAAPSVPNSANLNMPGRRCQSSDNCLDYSSSSISTDRECDGSSSTGSSCKTDNSLNYSLDNAYLHPAKSLNSSSKHLPLNSLQNRRGLSKTEGHCPSSSSLSSSTAPSGTYTSKDTHHSHLLTKTVASSSVTNNRMSQSKQISQCNKEDSSEDKASNSSSSSSSSSNVSSTPKITKSMTPHQTAAISRKQIISKSQEGGLNNNQEEMMMNNEEDDDVWYDKDALFRHHLKEVLDKWSSIDDEIWGKIICMEKNRRVAKAYARVPVLTINGSEDGFDGYRIGLAGFDNPKRHPDTERAKQHIGQGIKLKMDNDGNILIKRVSSSPVYVYNTTGDFRQDNCFSSELLKSHGQLEADKPIKVFDMKRFTLNIAKEMKGSYPDRRKLELQCFTNIVFVEPESDHLEMACWVMLINIVALDMLKNKLPSHAAIGRPMTPSSISINGRHSDNLNSGPAKRFLSTPRDEHYPRLMQQHSMADLSMLENTDYNNEDFDDRASISTYNFVPAYRSNSGGGGGGSITPSMMASDYADMQMINQQQRREMYRTLEQQHYASDPYYGMDLVGNGYAGCSGGSMMGNGVTAYRSATPLGLSHHALTEPNFKLRDNMGISGRNLTAPSLQRFAAHSRHSRSYDSGLESDLTSSSDETDNYNRWTSYQRLHMLPRQMQQQVHRLPAEWE